MKQTTASRIQLCWYYHAPTVMTDSEVDDLVRESLSPLIDVHRRTGRRFVLAITGTFTERLRRIRPKLLDQICDSISDGLIELAGTFYYEIFPPIVPYGYLNKQIDEDLSIKREIFGCIPTTFFLPNFTWVSILGPMLVDREYNQVILDQAHFNLCVATQVWKWECGGDKGMETQLIDTVLDSNEIHQPFHYLVDMASKGRSLHLFFRDFEIVKRLSFGNTGVLQKMTDQSEFERVVGEIAEVLRGGACLTLADDGDRINPISLSSYELFLDSLSEGHFRTPAAIAAETDPDLPRIYYVPSYSVANVQEFWLKDIDALHYTRLLDEVYSIIPENSEAVGEIMELQDVYFLFWKVQARKRYYLNRVFRLLQQQ